MRWILRFSARSTGAKIAHLTPKEMRRTADGGGQNQPLIAELNRILGRILTGLGVFLLRDLIGPGCAVDVSQTVARER
jgi:hypothetical protein